MLFKRKPKTPPEYLAIENRQRKAVIEGDLLTLFSVTGKKRKGQCQKWPTSKVKDGIYEAAIMWVKKGVVV